MKNFTNGSLVLRVWQFDGSSEIVAKFQYMSDAKIFAQHKADAEKSANMKFFYLAVCDNECEAKAYFPAHMKKDAA